MKAISIKEPWATLIKNGEKTIETRTWKTEYRGKLLLCCSKYPKTELSGMAFAIVDLVDIRVMVKDDEPKAMCEIYAGAFSWFLQNKKNIDPFPVRGQLRLFEVEYP